MSLPVCLADRWKWSILSLPWQYLLESVDKSQMSTLFMPGSISLGCMLHYLGKKAEPVDKVLSNTSSAAGKKYLVVLCFLMLFS